MGRKIKIAKRSGGVLAAIVVGVLVFAPPAEAAIVRGLTNIIGGLLQLPLRMLAGTFSGPPVVGTIAGAFSGLFTGVGMVASGALDLVGSALSIAKTVGPYVLPFVL